MGKRSSLWSRASAKLVMPQRVIHSCKRSAGRFPTPCLTSARRGHPRPLEDVEYLLFKIPFFVCSSRTSSTQRQAGSAVARNGSFPGQRGTRSRGQSKGAASVGFAVCTWWQRLATPGWPRCQHRALRWRCRGGAWRRRRVTGAALGMNTLHRLILLAVRLSFGCCVGKACAGSCLLQH